MNNLISKIDNFIIKQIKFRSPKEAEQYGVRLPKEAYEKPKGSKWGTQTMPKTSKLPKQPGAQFPKSHRPRKPKIPGEGVIEEVGRQLTPLGPYRSPGAVAGDIKESERLARKITGVKKQ